MMRSMAMVRPRMSYADLERMPDDGKRYELYDGEVFEMPAPTIRHQRVAFMVTRLLHDYERRMGGMAIMSPVDIVLSTHDVVQPDAVYFVRDRVNLLDQNGPARVPPDLAVEVLSPGTVSNDRGRKMRLLARYGVKEYWLVDPVQNLVERHDLSADDFVLAGVAGVNDMLESRVLIGVAIPGEEIFRD